MSRNLHDLLVEVLVVMDLQDEVDVPQDFLEQHSVRRDASLSVHLLACFQLGLDVVDHFAGVALEAVEDHSGLSPQTDFLVPCDAQVLLFLLLSLDDLAPLTLGLVCTRPLCLLRVDSRELRLDLPQLLDDVGRHLKGLIEQPLDRTDLHLRSVPCRLLELSQVPVTVLALVEVDEEQWDDPVQVVVTLS